VALAPVGSETEKEGRRKERESDGCNSKPYRIMTQKDVDLKRLTG